MEKKRCQDELYDAIPPQDEQLEDQLIVVVRIVEVVWVTDEEDAIKVVKIYYDYK